MLFTMTGKHIEITEALRQHAQEKADKLPRFYDHISQVEVILEGGQGGMPSVEVIARIDHVEDAVARETNPDAYTCIDMAFHKVERQLKKTKEKQRDNKHVSLEEE